MNVSNIVYEGIGWVSILYYFFYEKFLHTKKKHKKQTSEIKCLLFRYFKRM